MRADDLTPKRLGVRDPIETEAMNWLLKIAETPHAETDCAAWRSADPAHERAWRKVVAIWDKAGTLGAVERPAWRTEINQLRRPGHAGRALWQLAAAAGLIAAVGLAFSLHHSDLSASTATAEVRDISLTDGTLVSLSPRSRVRVQFAPFGRRVELGDGEAFFEVAHDRRRPFWVRAGDAEIRVTGTKFDVRKIGDNVRVTVLEGHVEVRRRNPGALLRREAPRRVLTAGESSELAPGAAAFSPKQPAMTTPGGWRSGRLSYVETPLADMLADIERYSPTRIRIADPQVAQLKVTMSFAVSDLQGFVDDLPAALPVRETREADGSVVLTSAPSRAHAP